MVRYLVTYYSECVREDAWIVRPSRVLVGLIQSVEVLDKTGQIREFPLLTASDLKHCFFPAFGLKPKYQLFPGLEPACFATSSYIVSSPESPVYWLQSSALDSLFKCVSHFLTGTFFLCVHTHPTGSVSLGNPDEYEKLPRDKATGSKTKKEKAEKKCNYLRLSYRNFQIQSLFLFQIYHLWFFYILRIKVI